MYDFLIVGSGLYGAVFACMAHRRGYRCLVLEKRKQTGGNIYCEEKDGIHIHQYGPHIFHTSNREVWDFVNALVPFNRYTNAPVARSGNRLYNLPFNMNTFYQLWGVCTPAEAEAILQEQRRETVEKMRREGKTEAENLEEQALLLAGKDIYETLIKDYTEKQWGRPCRELPAFIIRRLPLRLCFDNNYFKDLYQGIPEGGYNRLTEALLEGVDVLTDTDYLERREHWNAQASKIVYTGRIDEFYDFRFGHLEYRTVCFEEEKLMTPNFQGNAVVNYTDRSVPYTRIIEHKHFEVFGEEVYRNPVTYVSREYSVEWKEGLEPYYPINDEKNNRIYRKYRELARKEKKVIFGGRLAEYQYYDMHHIVEKVLNLWKNEGDDQKGL